MGWSAAAVVLTSVLMAWEGVWFLRRNEPPLRARRWGLLLLVVAGWSLIWARLFFLGRMVVSPEFGVLMVQGGSVTRLGLSLFFVGIALGAGIAWYACQCHEGCKASSRLWMMGAALGIGLITALRIQSLEMEEPGLPHIYSHDLWSPLLLLWLCLCLAGSILGLLRVKSRLSLVWFTMVLVTVLAIIARGRAEYTESDHAAAWGLAWKLLLWVTLPAGMGLAAWIASRNLQRRSRWRRAGIRLFLALVLASFGLFLLLLVQWALWGAFAATTVAMAAHTVWRTRAASTPALPPLRRHLALCALLLLPVSVFVPLRSATFDLLSGLSGLMVGWVLLVDALLDGPLSRELQYIRQPTPAEGSAPGRTPLRSTLHWGGTRVKRLLTWGKGLFTLSSLPIALVKLLVGLVLLIALSEVPNAGKTIIQPFRITGVSSDDEKELGLSIADNLLNSIGALHQELRPEVMLQQPGGERDDRRNYSIRGPDSTDTTTLFAPDTSLGFGNVKIPIHLLIAPIQIPVRALLGTRVIQGTLHENQSQYTLLAATNTGETWTVVLDKRTLAGEVQAEPKPTDAIPPLTQQLAFQIISADPQYANTGITRSWKAWKAFKLGMQDWESVESKLNFDDLTKAIEAFREATKEDPGFVLAYYRLGMALQADGQFSSATEAYRESVTRNPGFLPGQVALAFSLFNTNGQSNRLTVASPPAPKLPDEAVAEYQREARELWRQIIQMPDQAHSLEKAQAYFGLCLLDAAGWNDDLGTLQLFQELQRAAPRQVPEWQKTISEHLRSSTQRLRRAYFYCKRAERTYERLSLAWHEAPLIREEKALVLDTLGTLLEKPHQTLVAKNAENDWICSPHQYDETQMQKGVIQYNLAKSPHLRAARHYFERAAELADQPESETNFQCHAAMAAKALGDDAPMELLKESAMAHILAAEGYSDKARSNFFDEMARRPFASVYYMLALNEYQRAAEIDPTNITALNGYAYTFWQWRYHEPHLAKNIELTKDIKLPEMAHRAEAFARKAFTLAKNSGSQALQLQTQSTLGEVLLAVARPGEAIQVLSEAREQAFEHPYFDEIRWDLAQAYLCEAYNELQMGLPIHELQRQATTLFKEIHQHDLEREDKLFVGQSDLALRPSVDPHWAASVCQMEQRATVEAKPDDSGPVFVLKGGAPQYRSNGLCDWLGIQAEANTSPGEPVETPLQLHVWGGGIDTRIPVNESQQKNESQQENVLLNYEPQDTRDYYFAQLEDGQQHALSEAYPIRTFANASNGRCTKNQINLTFEPQRGS